MRKIIPASLTLMSDEMIIKARQSSAHCMIGSVWSTYKHHLFKSSQNPEESCSPQQEQELWGAASWAGGRRLGTGSVQVRTTFPVKQLSASVLQRLQEPGGAFTLSNEGPGGDLGRVDHFPGISGYQMGWLASPSSCLIVRGLLGSRAMKGPTWRSPFPQKAKN